MPAPTTWASPTSGGTLPSAVGEYQRSALTFTAGYWCTVNAMQGDDTAYLRSAVDPTGAWGTAHTYTTPGVEKVQYVSPVDYGDGTWAFSVCSIGTASGNLDYYSQIIYTTDPTGTWSETSMDTSNPRYVTRSLRYLNGQWVQGGMYVDGTTAHPYIATASSVTGTWTYDSTDAGTGTTGSSQEVWIDEIQYLGGTYVHRWRDRTFKNVLYSANLSGAWGTATTPTAVTAFPIDVENGYFVLSAVSGGYTEPYYSSSGTAFTLLSRTDVGLSQRTWGMGHNGEYWVAGGAINTSGAARVSYLQSSGSPAGVYTVVNAGFSGVSTVTVKHDGTYFVGVDTLGAIRYCYAPSPRTGPTTLRQRQSETRTPSRVRGVDLRQRQTTRIR